MPKKNISRLVPVKRSVTNKKTGTINDITYYIDPDKDTLKKKAHNKKETTNDDNKHKDSGNIQKDTDNTGVPFEKVHEFEDFDKYSIDPSAARQFFCNM